MKKGTIVLLQRLAKIKRDVAIADLVSRSNYYFGAEDAWGGKKVQLKDEQHEQVKLRALPADPDAIRLLSSWEPELRAGMAQCLDDLRLAQASLEASQDSLIFIESEIKILNEMSLEMKGNKIL